ncbi:MAG: glycosyltransferase family 4 protein [Candidatus Omnitrophica bacterium]|nr:glycosyltransferase family 4 protein [Candidatus Omnitrophota bacterium]
MKDTPSRILVIAPQPFFTPRGTPLSVYHRLRVMAALGYRADLLTYPLGKDVALPGVVIHRSRGMPFIKAVRVGPSWQKLVLDFFLMFKGLAMLASGRYTCLIVHEEAVFFALVYRVFFKDIHLVYDMHSSLPEQLKNFGSTKVRLVTLVFEWLERQAIRRADWILTISPRLDERVRSVYPRAKTILIENSLFDPVVMLSADGELDEEFIAWDRFAGKKIVLYAGTFEPYQGLRLILESVGAVVEQEPGALFVLVGGSGAQVAEMRALARRLNISGHTVFTGILHPNTVKLFVRRADCLVSPRNRGTNTPLKIYEYLASGKPIVATRHVTHTQVLTDREAVLVEAQPQKFAQGILSVLNGSGKGVWLAEHARSLYERAYGYESYCSRMKEVLNDVA